MYNDSDEVLQQFLYLKKKNYQFNFSIKLS